MSELKVNKITPKTGTSIQLGESGDTITIPCGATLTNNGTATGFGLSFCTTVKTSPFTATANKGFLINTGSAVTVTLPASPSTGDELIIVDQTGQAATNNITLGRNGSKIKGGCIDAKMKTNRGGLRLVYSGSSQGWITATAGNDAVLIETKYVTATGGTVTTSGDYKIHTFNSDANFVVSCAGTPTGSSTVDYLVVAGGGGGGGSNYSGAGGGAGGYRFSNGTASGCYSAGPSPLGATALPVSATTYPISIGAGGAGGTYPGPQIGVNGNNSVFSTITSHGGGYGGGGNGVQGGTGGSGGGNAGDGTPHPTVASGNTPPVSPPQGFPGGQGSNSPPAFGAGGGGGASAAGNNGTGSPPGGTGGDGLASSITGSPVTRGGGGGGGVEAGGDAPGGAGGGGKGTGSTGCAGSANTGGGGGGAGNTPHTGGAGGSGVVIIRYKYQN